jgi:hypothetical protein
MEFRIAQTSANTGVLLEQMVRNHLSEMGVTEIPDAVVCYGSGYSGDKPALNAKCSTFCKYEQAKILSEKLGENAIKVLSPEDAILHFLSNSTALFARKIVHSRGRDIRVALESWQIPALVASGSEFFTPHIESIREYRVWVYRRRHLGSYEKILRRPEECRKLGRNHANGFDFSGIDHTDVPESLVEVASKAVEALNLDFGAVDILQTPSGQYVVVEVNTAPGVGSERRKVICNLSKRIAKWIKNGCKRRNGTGE